jgi:uncharacterized membrane protein YqgA involved in biofilm formation
MRGNLMPVGIIVNAISIFLGGMIGALLGDKIPYKLRTNLPNTFGIASLGMGVTAIMKVSLLPAVVLSFVVGTAIGELLNLEEKIERMAQRVRGPIAKLTSKTAAVSDVNESEYMNKLISIMILFCASGTGIYGSLTEGMTGDSSILFTKSILDFFTSAIFATALGFIVALIALPQFVIFLALFLSAGLILPLATPAMIADFTAAGGLLMLAAGFRISGIKSFAIANMLPALILIMPISYLWALFL